MTTILDRIKWNRNAPFPPNQGWRRVKAKTRHFPITDFGGRGGLNFPFNLSKIVAPWAGKMNEIARYDWLPERTRWSDAARSGLLAWSRKIKDFACQDIGFSQIFIPIISNGEKILSIVNVVVWRQAKSENSSHSFDDKESVEMWIFHSLFSHWNNSYQFSFAILCSHCTTRTRWNNRE